MELDLRGKTAIVTGASRGIGRAIAHQLSAEGMRLMLTARSRAQLEAVAAECGRDAFIVEADLREPDAARRVIAAALDRFGAIDALVNNAGATRRGDFLELADGDWQDGFALKFFGAMRCCREAWPHLRAHAGAIVNIVGVGGRTGSAEFTIGGSVNAALLNLTKCLADRGVREGVRVNAINPGSIATERLTTRVAALAAERSITPAAAAHGMAERLGVARFGAPEEIARVVAFLLSPAAGYCQGAVVDVDGGQTRTL
jgi:NAD(P)-dependent dehydrogenase (short-subunit alcohol dehydrogenase family)